MDKSPIILKKLSVELLLDLLGDLYDKGAEYVDLIGIPDEEQDVMTVVVRKEYMAEGSDPDVDLFGESDNVIISGVFKNNDYIEPEDDNDNLFSEKNIDEIS